MKYMRRAFSTFFSFVGRSFITPWIVCLAGAIFILGTLVLTVSPTQFFSWKQSIAQNLLRKDTVAVKDQRTLEAFIVLSRVRLTKPGFVVVRFVDAFNSPSDYIVGVSSLLQPGEYKNMQILIRPDDFVGEEAGPKVHLGSSLVATEYYDTGNGVFLDGEDLQVTDIWGNFIMSTFRSI